MSIYGLLIGVAFIIGFELFSKKNNIFPKNKENYFFILIFVFSILGARIYSVISNWDYYSKNLIEIFNTRNGGLGIFGGLSAGAIFILIFSRINKLSFLKITNLIVPYLALGQSIGRWGNFINTEVFGIPTLTSFGQFIPQNLRPLQYQNFLYFHPVWLYESILDFILFLILIKTKKNQTALYLISYGLIRFFMEFLRWDTWYLYGIKVGQVLALLLIIIGLNLLNKNKV